MMIGTVRRALAVTALVLLWLLVAPASAGGAASYVTVDGNSMYPTFHSGDTVMLTRHSHYEVGDIIAYHSQLLAGAVIIHRIIDVTADGRYVTKGDHNNFIDEYQPAVGDILGKRVVRLPGTAKWSDALSNPTGIAVLALAAGTFVYLGRDSGRARHRHRAMRGRMS